MGVWTFCPKTPGSTHHNVRTSEWVSMKRRGASGVFCQVAHVVSHISAQNVDEQRVFTHEVFLTQLSPSRALNTGFVVFLSTHCAHLGASSWRECGMHAQLGLEDVRLQLFSRGTHHVTRRDPRHATWNREVGDKLQTVSGFGSICAKSELCQFFLVLQFYVLPPAKQRKRKIYSPGHAGTVAQATSAWLGDSLQDPASTLKTESQVLFALQCQKRVNSFFTRTKGHRVRS